MPVISRFQGIVIKMYLRQKEHNPPHIHAISGDSVGMFSLPDGIMFEGDLDSKKQKMVKEFINTYGSELLHMWETQQFQYLSPIE
ncbi:MAG: DUF4160 domain-containing protein [Lachnospiraceae bacterium]|nr:DUF4160 domain-containing protein [Lachnospiraceae bacterium]MCD8347780.1 DUF4160 domain-containing protein [Lachnospiraceae bacterium]MCD8398968.1 DUF4160 domain-containing protein [Lachnospiraceae bacterium]